MERSMGSRSQRGAALVVVVVASLVAFASLGGIGFAQSAVGLAQYQYGKKMTICHKGKRNIRISVRAWPAHKRHGDVAAVCQKVEKHAKKAHLKKAHAEKAHAEKAHAEKAQSKTIGAKVEHEKSDTPTGKQNGQAGKSERSKKPEQDRTGNKGRGNDR